MEFVAATTTNKFMYEIRKDVQVFDMRCNSLSAWDKVERPYVECRRMLKYLLALKQLKKCVLFLRFTFWSSTYQNWVRQLSTLRSIDIRLSIPKRQSALSLHGARTANTLVESLQPLAAKNEAKLRLCATVEELTSVHKLPPFVTHLKLDGMGQMRAADPEQWRQEFSLLYRFLYQQSMESSIHARCYLQFCTFKTFGRLRTVELHEIDITYGHMPSGHRIGTSLAHCNRLVHDIGRFLAAQPLLKNLNLDCSDISLYLNSFFKGNVLRSLENLSLYGNEIENEDLVDIEWPMNLRTLDLGDNELTEIPGGLPPKLEDINLGGGNDIDVEDICRFLNATPNVKIVRLACNNIEEGAIEKHLRVGTVEIDYVSERCCVEF